MWVSTVTRDWLGSMVFYGIESRRNCSSRRGAARRGVRSRSSNLDGHGRLRCSGKEIDEWFIPKRINAGPPSGGSRRAGAGAGASDDSDAGGGPSRVMVGSSA